MPDWAVVNEPSLQVLASLSVAVEVVCQANESAIPAISGKAEVDALIKKTVMQRGESFSFRMDPKQSIKKLFKTSQWYEYACGYSYSANGSVYTVNLHLKDSTRMLLGHKNPEYRKRLNSRELSALECLEARLAKLIVPGMSECEAPLLDAQGDR